MGLFAKDQRAAETAADPPGPGPGLIVTSELDPDECLRALDRTLLSFRIPEYTRLPTFTAVSWTWAGEPAQAPATVIICADFPGEHVLVALWPDAGGSRIGLIPLSGDELQEAGLENAMLAAWRQRDPSLSRPAGRLGAGLVRLVPPVLPAGYAAEIVAAAGYPRTRRNIQIITRTAGSLFRGRADLFIEPGNPARSGRFIRRHSRRQPMNEAALQQILDDLARADPALLPYLQWLPVRTRAVMLEYIQDSEHLLGRPRPLTAGGRTRHRACARRPPAPGS